MKIFFINYDGSCCSVYDSQVFFFCKFLYSSGYDVYLINYEKCTDKFKYKLSGFSDPNNIEGIETYTIYKIYKYDFMISRYYIKQLKEIIRSKCNNDEKIILHCRGHFASLIGINAKKRLIEFNNIKVISDIRGLAIDEYKLRFDDKSLFYKILLHFIIKKLKKIERCICNNANYISCVSENIKRYFINNYLVKPGILVIPTCIPMNDTCFNIDFRNKMREKLNISEKFVIVYCGGGQKWQNTGGMAELFKELKKQINESCFLIITKDNNVFEDCMKEHDILKSDYIIVSANHNDVFKYLCAGDCAFLIREASNLNAASSPTKFAEYIKCHLPVIISHGIGNLDEIINDYNVGIFIDNIENLKQKVYEIQKNGSFEAVIEKYFDLDMNIKRITEVYKSI